MGWGLKPEGKNRVAGLTKRVERTVQEVLFLSNAICDTIVDSFYDVT